MNKKHPGKFLLFLTLLLGVVLVIAACGGQQAAPPAAPAEKEEAEAPAEKEEAEAPAEESATSDVTIKLAENPWSGSQVNVAVAQIVIEEQLGYPVEIVTLDENAQWAALAGGDLHASLEVWPSGHADNIALYIDEQKSVENAGLLGPVGAIGWFMPKYMLDKDPDLATWEGFQKPEAAALFATAETGDKGQFLAGDQSWVQYDADIINNLGIDFEVITAGSEEALLAALDSAYSREEGVVFYFWTPHSVFAKYDIVQVELPAYSDECYAKADEGGIDCAYPADELFKIVSAKLKDEAPDVDQFLRNFNYTSQDQISMIAGVELDGKSPAEAARAWVDANEATWQAWLSGESAAPAEAPAEVAAKDVTIKLAENPWSGSQVNVAVAKILLENQMGYPVEIVTLDENAQWAALAGGDLHASLEVWPSGHADNIALYIDEQKSVEDGGLLGPVGAIGWFMPAYMLDKDPDLATWEGFLKPEAAAFFATAETGDKGQFLAGDQSWVQYDADIINNLGMDFEVVTAGSEEALLAALDSAYSREEGLVFYFWTPHSVFAKYDMVQVELPAYSDECYAKANEGGIDCAYPSDELFKIISAKLKDEAPDADQFLRNFSYTTQDQISMIAAVELDGKSAEEAAQAWVDANESTWKAWIP